MKLSGGQYILKYLEKEKVKFVAGIPGHGVLSFFDALREEVEKGNIQYIQVKHEQAAVHMADAYYRVSGIPAATISSIGPGSINTAIGLATAYVDSSAVISFCGDTHTNMKGTGVLQEIERYQDSNFLRVLEPITKRSWRVENVSQLPRIMDRAFNSMKNGRVGPVSIALPMDIPAETIDVDDAFMPTAKAKAESLADSESIKSAVQIMEEAKRPVILLGGGAIRAKASEEIRILAEKWGAAVITTLAGKSAFPENHPLYCYHTGSKGTKVGIEICRSADVILALGARFADETTSSYRYGSSFSFPTTKLIHVDLCAEEIGKNYAADLGIVADLKSVAKQLAAAYPRKEERQEYFDEIRQKKEKWAAYIQEKRNVKTEHCTISQLIGVMNDTLPPETILVTSSGNTQAQMLQEYCFEKPYTCLTTGGFSTMGWSVPAAAGAKLASPETPVVALVGDGDFLMTMQELSTIIQYEIPIIIVVANNCGWFAIKDLQHDAYGDEYMFGNDWMKGTEVYTPDYAAVAKAFGMEACKISKAEEVADAVNTALKKNIPYLIEVDVCRDYPNTGGEAFGWWDVPVPEYIKEKWAPFQKAKTEEFRRKK